MTTQPASGRSHPNSERPGRALSPAAAPRQRAGHSEEYTGVGILEVLTAAVNYRRFLTELLTRAAGTLPRGAAVADFGAGIGTFSRDARLLGWQVTCVELDPDLRKRLSEDGFGVAASLDDIEPDSLDFLFTYNVLEHIEDHASIVAGFRRVLKPGAPLLIYVPAFPVLYGPMDRAVGHVRRYRKPGLRELAVSAGFTVLACEHADSLGFPAALAHRFVGSRSGQLSEGSVKLYDRFLFPVSRQLDRAAHPFIGKNLILIARRPGA